MARITRAAALAAVVFAALVPVPAAQSPTPPELALAMIRPDGILTPFAAFDGKTWTAAWPEPQDKMVLDRMIEHVQSYWKQRRRAMPLAWHVVRPGLPALKVNVLEHIVFGEHCGNQVGLLTDMPSRREVDSMPHARMLAADRPIAVEAPDPTVKVPRPAGTSPEWALTLRPLGTLQVGGSTFRVVVNIGFEGEGMSVIEVGAAGEREVLRTLIGGC
jgi:hypothetical protein